MLARQAPNNPLPYFVQSGATNTANAGVASGAAGTIFASNVTVGNRVILLINDLTGDGGTCVPTGLCATWTQLDYSGAGYDNWLFVGKVTTAGEAVTATLSSGSVWTAAGIETSHGSGDVAFESSGSSAAPAASVTTIALNQFVITCMTSNAPITSGPGGTWISINKGDFTNALGKSFAYQIVGPKSTVPSAWTFGATHTWDAFSAYFPVSP